MQASRKKYRIFYKLEQHLEIPMFILGLVWLYFFIVEMVSGLNQTQEYIIYSIWIAFIAEFIIKLIAAPRRLQFLKNNWLTIIALVVPAFRVLRIFRAFRLLRSVRVINSTKIIRAITSGKRFFTDIKEVQGPAPEPVMQVGIVVAAGAQSGKDILNDVARQLIQDVKPELEEGTGIKWEFDITPATVLENDKARTPSDFLDTASFRMAEGPYDMVHVITDVPLISRRNRSEPGLCSPVARITVMSTRKPASRIKERPPEEQYSCNRYNAALLFLHLTGHLLGLNDTTPAKSRIMGVADFNMQRNKVPSFSAEERSFLKKKAYHIPDRELSGGNSFERFVFHIIMTFRHLGQFFQPLLSNKAVLLPLSLPGLATAAVAPSILMIFSAELWDVGLGMSNGTAAFFAVVSVMLASFYLVRVQSLFLPRKEKRVITEHLAVANSTIYFSIFLACVGLFLMVGTLSIVVELYIFPEGLMQTWPTLDRPQVTLEDKIRLAVFISTLGVTTGALAGGLESRTIIQHLALFRRKV